MLSEKWNKKREAGLHRTVARQDLWTKKHFTSPHCMPASTVIVGSYVDQWGIKQTSHKITFTKA